MATTTNYGLYLTDDALTKFIDWRNLMNGTGDSNMVKIDAILKEKADSTTMDEALEQIDTKLDEAVEQMDTKLDEATELLETTKADNSVPVEGTLLASGWVGDIAPFTQEILVDGLTADQNGTIALSQSATAEQRAEAREALMCVSAQEDGKLVVLADGEKPEIDLPITIVLLG